MKAFLSVFTPAAPVLQALQGNLQMYQWGLNALSLAETVPTAELREA